MLTTAYFAPQIPFCISQVMFKSFLFCVKSIFVIFPYFCALFFTYIVPFSFLPVDWYLDRGWLRSLGCNTSSGLPLPAGRSETIRSYTWSYCCCHGNVPFLDNYWWQTIRRSPRPENVWSNKLGMITFLTILQDILLMRTNTPQILIQFLPQMHEFLYICLPAHSAGCMLCISVAWQTSLCTCCRSCYSTRLLVLYPVHD